ncbi:glycosyltransferase [Couchioplanes caeruleus]|uniref:glycosyltransferase n=1 Tax=Couchioplanes caeruleus TaxID=56438 RepID=UPI0014768D35|nr:glycosyltransferase [Couchioplanes caeruleus]
MAVRILFLLCDAFGVGGTVRTTFSLASALAAIGHDVEVLSMFRSAERPVLPLDPAVRLRWLVETRPSHEDFAKDDPRQQQAARVFPLQEGRYKAFNLLVEQRARAYLYRSDAQVVISTRSGLIAYAAEFAPDHMIRIGQEHLTRRMNHKGLRAEMRRHYRRLDAFVTVTASDAEDYRTHHRFGRTRLLHIPNGVPAPQVAPSHGRTPLVVAAGRLAKGKRFDVLIRAFAKVSAAHPEWQMRIYGRGPLRDDLRALVAELGLHNRVLFMGVYSPLEPEWAKAAIAAASSDREAFGMTLVEAARCGAPVISTAAPHGPAEIVRDGVDGRLSPVGDPEAFADALLELVGDEPRRLAMGAAAREAAARFDPAVVAGAYHRLFTELAAAKTRPLRRCTDAAHRAGRRLRTAAAGSRGLPTGADGGSDELAFGPLTHTTATVGDVDVHPNGDLVVRLPAAVCRDGELSLVCRRSVELEHRYPLPSPAPGASQVQVVLRRGADGLTDGPWNLFLARPGDAGEPLVAGMRETRTLLDAPPEGPDGVHVRLPYRKQDGFLALRVWHRRVHAEVGDVHIGEETITVAGRLIGAAFGNHQPVLRLHSHTEPTHQREVPVEPLDPHRFQVSLPVELMIRQRGAETDRWQLRLFHDLALPAVRPGRLLDDVVDKRTAYAFPALTVADAELGPVRVQAQYTTANELSLLVEPAEPAQIRARAAS